MTSLVDNEKKKPNRNIDGLLDCSTCDEKTHPSFFENEEQCCDCAFNEEKRVNFDLSNNKELYFNKDEPVSKVNDSKKNENSNYRDESYLEDDNDYENNDKEKNLENKAFVEVMVNMQKMMKAQQEQMDNMNKLMQKFLESKNNND